MSTESRGEFVSICAACPGSALLRYFAVCVSEIADELKAVEDEGGLQTGELIDVSNRVLQVVPDGVEPSFMADLDQQHTAAMQQLISTQSWVLQHMLEIDLLKANLDTISCSPGQVCPKLTMVQEYARTKI